MQRFWSIVICSLLSTSVFGQMTWTNGGIQVDADYYDCRSTNTSSPILPTGFYSAQSDPWIVGTGTIRTQESFGPYDWPMRYRLYVSSSGGWFAAERFFFGSWRSTGEPAYIIHFNSTNLPSVVWSNLCAVQHDWTVESSYQVGDEFNGSVLTLLDANTGEFIGSGTVVNGAANVNSFIPQHVSSVDVYLDDTKIDSLSRPIGGGSGGIPSLAEVEKTPFEFSVGPGVTGGGLTAEPVQVEYEVVYQGGGSNGMTPGTVVYQGSIPAPSGEGGGALGGVDLRNLPLGNGTYSVTLAQPTYQWFDLGDGMGRVLHPVSTNVTTVWQNINNNGPQQQYYPGPPLPNSAPTNVSSTNSFEGIISTNSSTVTSNTVTVTNTITTTNSNGGSGEDGFPVSFDALTFSNGEFGESAVLGRATNLLTKVQEAMDNFSGGLGKLNAAAAAIASLQPPGASGSCTLQMGDYSITLGGGALGTARTVAGYLVALLAVFAAGRMIYDVFSS